MKNGIYHTACCMLNLYVSIIWCLIAMPGGDTLGWFRLGRVGALQAQETNVPFPGSKKRDIMSCESWFLDIVDGRGKYRGPTFGGSDQTMALKFCVDGGSFGFQKPFKAIRAGDLSARKR